ncbi:MAG: hypothetical protein ACJ8F7_00460 [Gemmataceae bacterium]
MSMICERVQEWLLRAESLAGAPEGVAIHLRSCPDCQRLVQRVGRLEQRWRDEPLPASAHDSRDAFLQRLKPTVQPRPAYRRWLAPAVWAVAASLLLMIGLSALLLSSPQKAHADPDVIGQLVDWNLEISEAAPEERQQLFAQKAEALKANLAKAQLSGEDRAIANSLMENGAWLTSNEEPLEEAERFNTLADQLLVRVETAAGRNDAAGQKLARQFQRVASRGVDAKLEQAKVEGDQKKQARLEKIQARDAKRLQELERLHELAPALTKKELKKVIEQAKQKKHKPNPKHGKRGKEWGHRFGVPSR